MVNFIKYIIPQRIKNKLKLFLYSRNKLKREKQIERTVDKKYYRIHGKHINWNVPTTYTEKICYSKVYGANQIKTKLTDKIAVREWVGKLVGNQYLVPLYGVYDSFDDIDFSQMPNQFVIKCNHDCNSVTLVNDKLSLNSKEIKKMRCLYNEFLLKRNFAYVEFEMQYELIKPRILIEKYLGNNVNDYKFLCFDGKPYYCWVDVDRFKNHKRNIYDMDWRLQPFNQMTYGNTEEILEKPESFEEMIKIVNILCKGFDHVRVDLYECGNQVYFGEMTFTNGAGYEIITPQEWDRKLGALWKLTKTN